MDELAAALAHARASGTLVRLTRRGVPACDAETDGFVVGAGAELVALHVLSDRIDLDGYEILPLRDVVGCTDTFASAGFYRRALEMKGEEPTVPTGLDLSSLPAALRSLHRHYPVIVLHRERLAPGEVVIGRVRQWLPSGIRLHWITPAAEWVRYDRLYRFASITRVQFDGEYERTLAMVAGPPPHADR